MIFANNLGICITIFLGALILFLPKRYALAPLIIGACYITLGQKVVIATLDFHALRILIVFGWLRLVIRGEVYSIKLNIVDKAIILWIISSVVIYTLARQNLGALINRFGLAFNALGLYFMFRLLIKDLDDFVLLLKIISIVIIPLAVVMVFESKTGKNVFSIFGGVPEISEVRYGRVRCQGPFRHPILAGTFGATLIPLFVSLWWRQEGKRYAVVGTAAAAVIMFTTASSGPLLTSLIGIIGIMMWRVRKHMKIIRWGILCSLLFLHTFMNAPVYYIFAHIGSLVGGGGWYRSYLIDQAISHIDEWWLLGSKNTSHWMPFQITDFKSDITNQFIGEGVNGGLITLILFIIIIVNSFRLIGRTLQTLEDEQVIRQKTIWLLGVSLVVHVASFISVSYFDQVIVSWFLLLASISVICSPIPAVPKKPSLRL